jgi:hypothetical protein
MACGTLARCSCLPALLATCFCVCLQTPAACMLFRAPALPPPRHRPRHSAACRAASLTAPCPRPLLFFPPLPMPPSPTAVILRSALGGTLCSTAVSFAVPRLRCRPRRCCCRMDACAPPPACLSAPIAAIAPPTLIRQPTPPHSPPQVVSDLQAECGRYGAVLVVKVPRPPPGPAAAQLLGTGFYGKVGVLGGGQWFRVGCLAL